MKTNGIKNLKQQAGKLFLSALLSLPLFLCSCSDQSEAPAPPKIQPELLLEIVQTVRTHQYEAALAKIQKLRALDPTSVFLAEAENIVRFNRMTAVVRTYLDLRNFDAALNTIHDYEKHYGVSNETTRAKNTLFTVASLDTWISRAKSARSSVSLRNALDQIDKITKNIEVSPKIENFIKKQRSYVGRLQQKERKQALLEIWTEIREQRENGDDRLADVLEAVYAAAYPGKWDMNTLLKAPEVTE